ncbi:MAG: hypothetical protein ACAH17_02900 [Candidatus Paceibacterota bacterium]
MQFVLATIDLSFTRSNFMGTEKGGLFVGNNQTQGLTPAPHGTHAALDWNDDGRAKKPRSSHDASDSGVPKETKKARREREAAEKKMRNTIRAADSHLDDDHYLRSSQDLEVPLMISTFTYSPSMG